ncbi:hypothetical protein SteCoe_33761 [Stentor coeruleus]|uniref:Uncharacterized protein n=1 Tax=Stentor coeruleus TaxID=5963 RepID=A0A1R2AW23_9CILI|nr:hypothetical protein SteCoe_33761 [Stentor coeruleus]
MVNNFALAFYGGALIALSSSLNYVFYGKITGLSGILNVVVGLRFRFEYFERLGFLVGLISAIDTWVSMNGSDFEGRPIVSSNDNLNTIGWIIGGIMIGIGSRWSGGCTSGHGVCGLPRFSLKSFIAICIFMPVGMATSTYLSSMPLFFNPTPLSSSLISTYKNFASISLKVLQALVLMSIFYYIVTKRGIEKVSVLSQTIFGWIFGMGLLISGMCSRDNILAFLTISVKWDPSLIIVMFTAIFINLVTFQGIIYNGQSLLGKRLAMPDNRMDIGNFIGPVMFGMGWGITGLCPGPALANFTVNPNCLLLVVATFVGQSIVDAGYDYSAKLKKN